MLPWILILLLSRHARCLPLTGDNAADRAEEIQKELRDLEKVFDSGEEEIENDTKNPITDPVSPIWSQVYESMLESLSVPVFSPLVHCRADAVDKMNLLTKSCRQGVCTNPDCDLCYGCDRKQYRSLEGSCNTVDNMYSGSKDFPFERNIPISKLNYSVPLDVPNIRLIAQKLLLRTNFQAHKSLNLLGVAYWQFFLHDLAQRKPDPYKSVKVKIPPGDKLYNHLSDITLLTTQFDNMGCAGNFSNNSATAWIDGSTIYGSSAPINTRLRTRIGGRIRLDNNGRLEFENSKPVTGHDANFWIGLYSLHTLFVKEHNSICDMLKDLHPEWLDEELFQHARLINSALMFKIFVSSLFPALQPGKISTFMGKWMWSGATMNDLYDDADTTNGSLNVFPPILGSPHQDTEDLVATSEDLIAVNRIHALVPDILEIYDHSTSGQNNRPSLNSYTALKFSFEFTETVKNENTDENLLYSLGLAKAGAIALHNYPVTYTRTTAYVNYIAAPTMGFIGFDLAVADLLRDRERGTPRYCEFLRSLGKTPPSSFVALTNQDETLAVELQRVYTKGIEQMDLLIGLMVDSQVRNNGLVPPLTLELILAHVARKLKSDRFYTKDFTTEIYTTEGMFWLRNNNLQTIISRHYPALRPLVENLKNPLAVWDINSVQSLAQSTDL